MSRFGPESNFYQALSLAADLVVLNVLVVFTSIPIVTVGASLRSANYVISELLEDRGANPVATYFAAFKEHWKASTIWGLIATGLLALGAIELIIVPQLALGTAVEVGLQVALMSGLALICAISAWFFYLEALAPLPFKERLTGAVTSAIAFIIPTLVGVVLFALPFVVVANQFVGWPIVVFAYLALGFALSTYIFQLAARPKVRGKD